MSDEVVLWVAVDPNPTPGGPPIEGGIAKRTVCRVGRRGISEFFKPICDRSKLPPQLTEAQQAQFDAIDELYPEGRAIVEHRPGKFPSIVVQLVRDAD